MDNAKDLFEELRYEGIYRDDGIAVFEGNWMAGDVNDWLGAFQRRVNELAESEFLEFTAEVWGANKDDGRKHQKAKVEKNDRFPFLSVEMCWSPEGELQFRVHLKKNQALKYLNRGSSHTEACFAAIPAGVMKRLASLTTRTKESEVKMMDELYPEHAKALRAAKLAPDKFPTLGEILDKQVGSSTTEEDKEKRGSQDTRNVRFCLGVSKLWVTPVHAMLKEVRNKHGLSWLRFSMSYHKFSNLREIFQGDLNRKLMDGIVSRDFRDQPCNCNRASKIDGKCAYNEECRKMCVVYKVICQICDEPYIGQTQQKLKNRMGGHFQDVKDLVVKDKKSDSFASHFAGHCKKGEKPSNDELRRMMKFKIIWQANAISCMKSFGKLNCSLCMRERIEILRAMRQEECHIINSCNEVYGACRAAQNEVSQVPKRAHRCEKYQY